MYIITKKIPKQLKKRKYLVSLQRQLSNLCLKVFTKSGDLAKRKQLLKSHNEYLHFMKKLFCTFIFCFICTIGAFAQFFLNFTGKDDLNNHMQLHSVVIENIWKNWADTIYYPDTTYILSGVGIEDHDFGGAFSVSQNTPNPFDGITDFTLTLPSEEKVMIEILDMAGHRVTGTTHQLYAGKHTFRIWLNTPQAYLLTVKAGKNVSSIKIVNNGRSDYNRIAHLQGTPISHELKSGKDGTHPFSPGDMMRYSGRALYNNELIYSDTIEQCQHSSESFELAFHPWGEADDEGHFFSTQKLFIPDGESCNGNCYNTIGIDVSGYTGGKFITGAEDIHYVRLKMEHSRIGNLWISIVCPNGITATILKKSMSSGNSECSSMIPPYDYNWQYAGSTNAHLGQYYKPDSSIKCDASLNPMGICWNYCWSDNTTNGYQYSCGNGSRVYETCNQIYATNPSPYGQSDSLYLDSTDVANMTNVFHPDISFNSLIGCPMNGHWEIRIVDGWDMDNGYVEEAEIVLPADPSWTSNHIPIVATGSVSTVSNTSAICNGSITNSGLAGIMDKGICWDTIPNPSISGPHTSEGQGAGTFSSTLTNLSTGTTYYYRAYATNVAGTAYGETQTFTTAVGSW